MEIGWYTAMSMDGRIATVDESLDFLDVMTEHDTAHGGFEGFSPRSMRACSSWRSAA